MMDEDTTMTGDNTSLVSRDEFPKQVKEVVARRAAFICSNPGCRAFTLAPSTEDISNFIYTGVISHITAAAPGGPRYDASLSPQERSSITNAILLCATCSVMIDKNQGIDFSRETLTSWKDVHEEWVRANLNKRAATNEVSINVGSVTSIHQAGGVTAGVYINQAPPERHLTPDQKCRFLESANLLDGVNRVVPLRIQDGSTEARSYTGELNDLFLNAGWRVVLTDAANTLPGTFNGLVIEVSDLANPSISAKLIASTFKEAGIDYHFQKGPWSPETEHFRIVVGSAKHA
jgi:hypothetical protein